MFLNKVTLKDIPSEKRLNFILPLGATEQHGPFLPFDTDTIIVDEIVKRIESKLPELIVLPTLQVTISKEHEGFYGSMWISEETLRKFLDDIYDSLESRLENIFLVSWHGSNIRFIKRYIQENPEKRYLNLELEDKEISEKTEELLNGPPDDHAGNTEASMVMAAGVEVSIDKDYKKKAVTDPFGPGKLIDKSPDGIADNHPEWVYSKEIGEILLNLSAEKAIGEIRGLLAG